MEGKHIEELLNDKYPGVVVVKLLDHDGIVAWPMAFDGYVHIYYTLLNDYEESQRSFELTPVADWPSYGHVQNIPMQDIVRPMFPNADNGFINKMVEIIEDPSVVSKDRLLEFITLISGQRYSYSAVSYSSSNEAVYVFYYPIDKYTVSDVITVKREFFKAKTEDHQDFDITHEDHI